MSNAYLDMRADSLRLAFGTHRRGRKARLGGGGGASLSARFELAEHVIVLHSRALTHDLQRISAVHGGMTAVVEHKWMFHFFTT